MNPEPVSSVNDDRYRLIKFALVIFITMILGLLLQAYRTTGLSSSNSPKQFMPLAQVVTNTPTPTSTATATTTPTLKPVELSFQNGAFPLASYDGMQDTYISAADQFGNYGLAPEIKVNGESSSGAADANSALLRWDISQIPPGSEVLSVTLTFNVISPTVDTYPIYQLLPPWIFNQATWIDYAGGLSWQLPGATGATDRGTQVLGSFAPIQSGTYTINLNRAIVQNWTDNPLNNNGLIISDSIGSTFASFSSAEATLATDRPKLTILFNYPAGTTPTPTYTLTPTSTAAPTPAAPTNLTAVVASNTQINLTWVDNSANEDGFEIERSPDGSTWTQINTTAADVTTYNDTGLSTNTTYYYRVRAFNTSGNSGYSNVASASTQATVTPTPTVSGTPPTPTATGTIVPNMVISKSVSPSQASVGQLFNFTIQITNNGLSPALSARFTDTFPSVVTITGAQTNQGTYSISSSTNTIVFTIGTINPNQSVRVGILAQVNNTAVTNNNYTNSGTLSYLAGSINQTATSNSVVYRILGSGTLPGTGLSAIEAGGSTSGIMIAAIILTIVLAALGIVALTLARRKTDDMSWSGWLERTGIILLVAALIFGLAGWGLSLPTRGLEPITAVQNTSTPNLSGHNTNPVDTSYQFMLLTSTPESLPDFPIPEPTLGPEHDKDTTDKSPIEEIQIPALGLDTVVKYVPFDGFTWKIAGLKQEVAWMGDTSWPGLGKNTGLAGHVTLVDGSNGPFRYLADLKPGDTIVISTDENMYTYTVREQVVVEDDDFNILDPTEKPQLTLITCTNWNTDMKLYMNRLAVFADLQTVEPIKTDKLSN